MNTKSVFRFFIDIFIAMAIVSGTIAAPIVITIIWAILLLIAFFGASDNIEKVIAEIIKESKTRTVLMEVLVHVGSVLILGSMIYAGYYVTAVAYVGQIAYLVYIVYTVKTKMKDQGYE